MIKHEICGVWIDLLIKENGIGLESGNCSVKYLKFIDFYSQIVSEFRQNGIAADLYLGNPKDFGKQLKYADSRNALYAIIAGSEEIEKNIVQVKDLRLGKSLSKNIESNEKWKEQPAQFPVKIEDLIKKISELIK